MTQIKQIITDKIGANQHQSTSSVCHKNRTRMTLIWQFIAEKINANQLNLRHLRALKIETNG